MAEKKRQLHLNAFLFGVGHHVGAWRHPDLKNNDIFDPENYVKAAQLAEKSKFDAVFFLDFLGLPEAPSEVQAQLAAGFALEPTTLLAYLAAKTSKIGLVSTVSTSYNDPFQLARRIATLDLLSNGRIGWNLVTSHTDYEAQNFGLDHQLSHADRYRRAHEYVDVVKGLWSSFEPDAFIRDVETGNYFDPNKKHTLSHEGEFYKVKGPLHLRSTVQRRPVIFQAGASEDGQKLAAYSADAVFTAAQNITDAQKYYSSVKSKLKAYGRSPESLVVLPGIAPVIGGTEAEAQRKYEELQELIPEKLGISILSSWLTYDFSGHDLDAPYPTDLPVNEGNQSRHALLSGLAKKEHLTLRQVIKKIAGGRGHWVVVGTPEQVADNIQQWFNNGAADGFNVLPLLLPNHLEDFTQEVVPILQRRGLFRKEYESDTLSSHLGLHL